MAKGPGGRDEVSVYACGPAACQGCCTVPQKCRCRLSNLAIEAIVCNTVNVGQPVFSCHRNVVSAGRQVDLRTNDKSSACCGHVAGSAKCAHLTRRAQHVVCDCERQPEPCHIALVPLQERQVSARMQ